RILGPAAVGGRPETRVGPRGGRDGRIRRVRDVAVRLLVGDLCAVRRAGTVDRRFVANLPVGLVATEEREVDSRVARGFDIGALLGRPVLVVTGRHEDLVLFEHARTAAIGVDVRLVGDVVAVLL